MQQEKLYYLEEIPPEPPKSKMTTFWKIRITLTTTTIQEYHNGVFTLHDDADEVAAAWVFVVALSSWPSSGLKWVVFYVWENPYKFSWEARGPAFSPVISWGTTYSITSNLETTRHALLAKNGTKDVADYSDLIVVIFYK